MADLQQLISQIPIDQVARQLGVDEQTAAEAVQAAVPALVGGLDANAQDPRGAASIESALGQHTGYDGQRMLDVDGADAQDGSKIVQHIFGGNQEAVISQLAGARGALGSGMLAKLLPLLAPLVMQWLAKQWGQRSGGAASGRSGGSNNQGNFPFNPTEGGTSTQSQPRQAPAPQEQSSGGLGDLLGGLLGGKGGGLGDLLGGLLGGGRR